MAAIDEIHTELPFYGIRRIRGELRGRGFAVGRQHVATLMRRMGITAIAPKRRLSRPAPGHKIYPYLLRGLKISEAGHVWCADITYLPHAKGLLLPDGDHGLGLAARAGLAALQHARRRASASRRSKRPWSATTRRRSSTPTRARSSPARASPAVLADHGVQISMDGRGRWLDNVFIERLWRQRQARGGLPESLREPHRGAPRAGRLLRVLQPPPAAPGARRPHPR